MNHCIWTLGSTVEEPHDGGHLVEGMMLQCDSGDSIPTTGAHEILPVAASQSPDPPLALKLAAHKVLDDESCTTQLAGFTSTQLLLNALCGPTWALVLGALVLVAAAHARAHLLVGVRAAASAEHEGDGIGLTLSSPLAGVGAPSRIIVQRRCVRPFGSVPSLCQWACPPPLARLLPSTVHRGLVKSDRNHLCFFTDRTVFSLGLLQWSVHGLIWNW